MILNKVYEDFRNFIYLQMDKINPNAVSDEYSNVEEKALGYYKSLEQSLSGVTYESLEKLHEIHNELESEAAKIYFEYGFLEGVKLIIKILTK